jgi:hypothetical protein
VLDQTLHQLGRYIVAPKTHLATVAVWSAHAHTLHSEYVNAQRSPRLGAQAATEGSGKTISLESIAALVPRPRMRASVSAASVLRVTHSLHPTWLLDEADQLFHDRSSDLLSILNSGDRKVSAWVERMVPTSDGGWRTEKFSVFGAVAFGCIGQLPRQLQDRTVVVQLRRALTEEVSEHLEDGTSPELRLLKRKLATWAARLTAPLPRPVLPPILMRQAGRTGDNWRPFIAIADLAGGQWPELIRAAALAAVTAEAKPSLIASLLGSIYRVFEARAADPYVKGDDRLRIPTSLLLDKLKADSEEEWETVNKGRPVTAYWLRDQLLHMLTPPGSQEWEGPMLAGKRGQRYSGYWRTQFEWAWQRYLPNIDPAPTSAPAPAETVPQPRKRERAPLPEPEETEPLEPLRERRTASIKARGRGRPQLPTRKYTRVAIDDTPDTTDTTNTTAVIADVSTADVHPPCPATDPAGSLNGSDPPSESSPPAYRLTEMDRAILEAHAADPTQTPEQLAKRFGQPKNRIAAVLGQAP